ncbi:hypothetical protein LINPERPRIM_LOCUS709 [Linum perenne]
MAGEGSVPPKSDVIPLETAEMICLGRNRLFTLGYTVWAIVLVQA